MQIREQMKADLTQAMKARDSLAVTTLRSVLGAIDNAEAIPVTEAKFPVEPVIGKSHEAPRKILTADDIRQILQHEVEERRAASAEYARLGQQAEAERLQKAAALIAAYLSIDTF
ncbi:MAG: GatB/YqeY domain-containing protein [Caldilineaceae bacterium]